MDPATDGDLSGVPSRHVGRARRCHNPFAHKHPGGDQYLGQQVVHSGGSVWLAHPPPAEPRTCGWEYDRLLSSLPLDHPMAFPPDRTVAPHRRYRHLGHDRTFRHDRNLGARPSLCRSEICGSRHIVGSHVPRHVRVELGLLRGHSGDLHRLRPPGAVATTMAAGGNTGNVGHRDHAHRPGLRGQLHVVCLL